MSSTDVSHHVGYQLKRAQHALRSRMDEALRSLEITTPQYAVLSILEHEPGLSGAALARRSFVTAQTMNPILVSLEANGLVERRPHPEHGRVIATFLTERGREVLARCHERVFAVEARMLAGVGDEQAQLLADLLRQCADRLEGGGSM